MKFSLSTQLGFIALLIIATPLSVFLIVNEFESMATEIQASYQREHAQSIISSGAGFDNLEAINIPQQHAFNTTDNSLPVISTPTPLGPVRIWMTHDSGMTQLRVNLPTEFKPTSEPLSRYALFDHLTLEGQNLMTNIVRTNSGNLRAVGTNQIARSINGRFEAHDSGHTLKLTIPSYFIGDSIRMRWIYRDTTGIQRNYDLIPRKVVNFGPTELDRSLAQTGFETPSLSIIIDAEGNEVARSTSAFNRPPSSTDAPSLFQRFLSATRQTTSIDSPFAIAEIINDTQPSRWVESQGIVGLAVTTEFTHNGRDYRLISTDFRDLATSLSSKTLTTLLGVITPISLVIALLIVGWITLQSVRLTRLAKQMESYSPITSEGQRDTRAFDEISLLKHSFELLKARVEVQKEYLEALAQRLTHELKTPLSIISSSLELQAMNPEQPDKYRERAQVGVDQFHQIFSSLTEARSLEASFDKATTQRFDVVSLCEDLLKNFQQLHSTHRFELKCSQSECLIRSKPELITQALTKILDNAVEFHQGDDPILLALDLSNNKLSAAVTNRGSKLPTPSGVIFESMVSIRAKKQQAGEHLGFGLYITRRIAEHLSGITKAAQDGNLVTIGFEIAVED